MNYKKGDEVYVKGEYEEYYEENEIGIGNSMVLHDVLIGKSKITTYCETEDIIPADKVIIKESIYDNNIKYITADQAREISNSKTGLNLNAVYELIQKAAECGEYRVGITYEGIEEKYSRIVPNCVSVDQFNNIMSSIREVLEHDGFNCDVDQIGFMISW